MKESYDQLAAGAKVTRWLVVGAERFAAERLETPIQAEEVNQGAVEAMAEIGIDISAAFPKPWIEEFFRAADVVVTMGCGDACPLFPGKRYEDWELDDPQGKSVAEIRPIRDEIGRRVRELLDCLQIPHTDTRASLP